MKRIAPFFIIFFFLISPGLKEPPLSAASSLRIGLMEEPKTLNPFGATDRWSKNITKQLYQSLYLRSPNTLEILPWLAKDRPQFNDKTNEVTVRLREARWEDGTPFTADDVAFTGDVIREFRIPSLYSDWNFITDIKALDKQTVKFSLSVKKAIFFSQTLLTPIVQKKQWMPVVLKARKSKNPLKALLEYQPEKILSNGPFRCGNWKQGDSLKLTKNEYFFAQGMKIDGYEVGPNINEIDFIIHKDIHQMLDALREGEIDYIWGGIKPRYLSQIRDNLKIYLIVSPMNAIQYLAFNLKKEPFHDKPFRQALAYLINKDVLAERILNNYGVRMDSIIPPGNTLWHNPDTKKYGKGLSRKERVQKAEEILKRAGYKWKQRPRTDKSPSPYDRVLLMPGGKPVPPFTILAPEFEYDPARALSARFIQEWWREIGLSVEVSYESFTNLMKIARTERSFDTVVLGWSLGIDPDYLRGFFHSRETVKYGKNFAGYKNPDFDRLAEASSRETDFKKRRELIRKMEEIIIDDLPYIPLYSPFIVDVYRLDRLSGWLKRLDGIGNIWSFLLVQPVAQFDLKIKDR